MRKKLLPIFLSVFALVMAMGICAHADDVKITINGTVLETDTEPVIINDRTMVPLRAISSALNCGVGWNAETRGITIIQAPLRNDLNEHLILCWIGRVNAFVLDGFALGNRYSMDSPPIIVNDRTLVPIRAISELLGAQVDWDDTTRTVIITAQVPAIKRDDQVAEDLGGGYGKEMLNFYDAYSDYADGKPAIINAEIGLENGGIIQLELYTDLAPLSVKNFVELAKQNAFNGTIFHRVIKDFMIQGGAFEKNGTQRYSDPITGEFIINGVLNLIPHERGVISMARTDDPDSGSNQFFIMHEDYPSLNGRYAAFGKVTSGMEYVDAIATTETDSDDKPIEDQVISYVKILD